MTQIKIATVDKTTLVNYESVRVERAITSQVDTAFFSITKTPSQTYKPTILDDVKIYEDSTVIFAGTIIEIDETIEGADVETINCICKDYSYDMDRTLVAATYESMTVNDIIDDINTNFLTGFTIANVDCPLLVNYIAFAYEYPSKCLQQLAELFSYDWYVDENKDIHFFSKSATPAPFDLTDTSDNYYYNTLVLKKDLKSLRNVIIVRGGEYEGLTSSETVIADGTALIYKQGLRYSNVTVTVNGSGKTVGVDFIDDAASFDCLYNFQEKFVRFKTATKPSNGQTVVIGGAPKIPVIIKLQNTASVNLYGKYEYKVIDKSINSKEGARDRAKAEIAGWANTVNEGSFETMTTGLKVGQQINIQSTIRGLDQDYVISRISSKLVNGLQFNHTVVLMTTQTFGMIEFFQKLLISKDKEIVINADEVVDTVLSADEEITIGESTSASKVHNPITEAITIGESNTVQSLNYAVIFVLGDHFAPSSTSRQFILNGSRLG